MSAPGDTRTRPLPTDDELISRARTVFGEACAHTDSRYAQRLRLARRHALGVAAGHGPRRAWVPMAGVAAACCALVAGVLLSVPGLHPTPTARNVAPAGNEETVDVGSSQQEIVQDLDFYRWLATQPAIASAARGGRH